MSRLNQWGPFQVLAIVAVLLVLAGGLANVVLDPDYTFRAFLDDIKYVAAALAAAIPVALGLLRGLRDHGLAMNVPGHETDPPDGASVRPDDPHAASRAA